MGKKNKKSDQSSEELMEDADDMLAQLEDMMQIQMEKIDTIIKKAAVYSVLWSIVAAIFYFVWTGNWYYWMPLGFAIVTTASLIFALVMRSKLRKKLS